MSVPTPILTMSSLSCAIAGADQAASTHAADQSRNRLIVSLPLFYCSFCTLHGCCHSYGRGGIRKMIEAIQDIRTNDGVMETFICHPERGESYPTVLFLMDAPGIRDELYDMARRLATVGYFVLLPN